MSSKNKRFLKRIKDKNKNIKAFIHRRCSFCEGGTEYYKCLICSLEGRGVDERLLKSGATIGAW